MATPVAALERRGVALLAAVTVLGLVAVADGYTMRSLPLWAEAISQNWFVAPFFAVAIYALARFDIHSLFLESKPVLALGDASYSIYLLHPTVIWMFAWQGTQKGAPFIEFKALVTFIAIGLFSLGVYRYLEWPARRFIRHVLLPAPGASPRYWPGQRFFRLRS
ncbi:MAG: acyltransferase [Proteobacteria bacterium]|nr:acyltransferase [Pseudomonadota bacterium]